MLRIAGLSAGYGAIGVLADIHLRVAEASCVAVVGSNGMGKTTLLKALMGLVPARAGRILLDGEDIAGLPAHLRSRAGIALVPQGRHIFPALTVRENLALGALEHGVRIVDAIAGAVARFPVLEPLLNRPGGVLSGGEQQITALARALCAKPRVLLLDEPTEGVQPSVVAMLEATLHDLVAERLAILLVEQNRDFVGRTAARTAIMNKGRLLDAAPVPMARDASG